MEELEAREDALLENIGAAIQKHLGELRSAAECQEPDRDTLKAIRGHLRDIDMAMSHKEAIMVDREARKEAQATDAQKDSSEMA